MARKVISQSRRSQLEKALKDIYYDVKSAASFGNATSLYNYGKSIYPDLTYKIVTDWLKNQYTHVVHRQTKKLKNRQFARFVSTSPNLNIDCDIGFFSHNKGKPVLVCTDAFSSYIMAQPLVHVNSNNVNKAFTKMIKEQSKFQSYTLQVRSDAGPEFARLQKVLPNPSKHFVTKLRRKAAFAENSIRKIRSRIEKLKTFTGREDVWPRLRNDILKSLNDTPLSTVKSIAPSAVNFSNAGHLFNIKFAKYLKDVKSIKHKPLFQIGDPVRITLSAGPFGKGAAKRYTEEVFYISKFQTNTSPLKYILKDSTQAEVPVSFYSTQLIKAEPNHQAHKRIERIVEQKTDPDTKVKQYKVTFKGCPKTHWISEEELEAYKKSFD